MSGTITAQSLLSLRPRELHALLTAGHPIEPEALDDFEYRGISLGLPAVIEALTWKTFKKVFHRDPSTQRLRGWNVRLRQEGLDGPWEPLRDGHGAPRTFGHFEVVRATPHDVPPGCERGLLIDYGRGRNGRIDPIRWLRDPLVALEAGSAELLLGWSYLDLGVGHLGTPSYFVLQRDIPLSHHAGG